MFHYSLSTFYLGSSSASAGIFLRPWKNTSAGPKSGLSRRMMQWLFVGVGQV